MEGVESVEELHFFYDAQSRPAFVEYEGEMYRYIHNLQGDIVAIVDVEGTPVVEYKYDAWGKLLSRAGYLTNSIGYKNPFCYRGYIYDGEIGMYWLMRRCYSPEMLRFINADDDIRGNLYEYCRNNPINRSDYSGRRSISHMQEMAKLHDFVGRLVAVRVFGTVERSKTFTRGAGRGGGPGYPDVIVTTKNMVWKVKPKTKYGVTSGPKQMKNYTTAGRIPGYSVTIEPFPYTIGGKEGMVYVTNGCTPEDQGVVYYEFREYEESRETESESAAVPVTVPASESQSSYSTSSVPVWGIIVLGIMAVAALVSPWPGDELYAGAYFFAVIQ